MSRGFYIPSSIYTRRQTKDVFYNDPFKIQSYNFRYADRPVYPVQHYQRSQRTRSPPVQQRSNNFETYYQNPRFKRNQEPLRTPVTSSFADHRRRSFLQDCFMTPVSRVLGTAIVSAELRRVVPPATRTTTPAAQLCPKLFNSSPKPTATNSPLLRTCCNQDDYQTMRRGQSVTTLRQSNCSTNDVPRHAGGRSASVSGLRQPERNLSTSTFRLSPKRSNSSCSGCAINISLSGMDSQSELDKSLRIKIETDYCLHNNTDKLKAPDKPVSYTARCGSSESFVIDKRLSKFNVPNDRAQTSNQTQRHPQFPTSSWTRQRECERDLLQAKHKLQLERQRMEQQRQEEQQLEQQRVQQREKERETLRELERQRDRDQLLERDAERERQRLREQAHKQRDRENMCRFQEQLQRERQQRLPMRAMSLPASNTTPVIMATHLQRPASTERLPGMAPCYVSCYQAARAERLRNSTRNLSGLRDLKPMGTQKPATPSPSAAKSLDRRSSGSSNYNVTANGSNASLRRPSATRLNEPKLLNLHVNGMPISSHQAIHTRINNMPIRITTSQPSDRNLQLSMNQVHLRSSSPMPGTSSRAAQPEQRRRSSSCVGSSSTRLPGSATSMPYNVNINVYADNVRRMRL